MPAFTTVKIFDIDLCPNKPDEHILKLDDTNVQITVTLVTKKKPAPIVMTRLFDKAVDPTTTKYKNSVQNSVDKLSVKVATLQQMKDLDGAKDEAKTVAHTVLATCNALQPAVDKAVQALVVADAKADTNLRDARIKVGVAITFKTITIALDATRIGLTLGADAHADAMIVKHCYDLGVLIYKQTKDEEKLRKEFQKAYDSYLDSRKLKQQAETSTLAAIRRGLTQAMNTWTSNASVAEAARKRYRDELTVMRQNLEKMSRRTAKLDEAFSHVPPEKQAKAAAKLKALSDKVGELYNNVTVLEKWSDRMSDELAAAFVQHGSNTSVDDRTFGERFGDAGTAIEILKNAREMGNLLREITDLATAAV